MTADVIHIRREIADIAARRPDSIRPDAVLSFTDSMARHPSVVAKQRQVERQQVLGALIKAIAEGGLNLDDTDVLPLIVDTLLRNCPQAVTAPDVVAKSIEEAAEAWGAQEDDALFGESAFIVAQLAAGTAFTTTYPYLLESVRALSDWLTAAAVARP